MTRRLFLLAGLAAAASFAHPVDSSAKTPDPLRSSVPKILIGCVSGVPVEGSTGFQVVVRDVNNTGHSGDVAMLDFSATSLRLIADQETGTTVDCAGKTLSRITGFAGVVTFAPRFSGHTSGDVVRVYADGVLLAEVPACSMDLDGTVGMDMADLSIFREHFFNRVYDPAMDFTGSIDGAPDGSEDLADLSAFRAEFFRKAPADYCH